MKTLRSVRDRWFCATACRRPKNRGAGTSTTCGAERGRRVSTRPVVELLRGGHVPGVRVCPPPTPECVCGPLRHVNSARLAGVDRQERGGKEAVVVRDRPCGRQVQRHDVRASCGERECPLSSSTTRGSVLKMHGGCLSCAPSYDSTACARHGIGAGAPCCVRAGSAGCVANGARGGVRAGARSGLQPRTRCQSEGRWHLMMPPRAPRPRVLLAAAGGLAGGHPR